MRIWSLHPRYLDRQGLVACWRETLLAQAVLAGRTKGYTAHPQLERFRAHPTPSRAVGAYLREVADEADRRGYRFDRARVDTEDAWASTIAVTNGQLVQEWRHLTAKLAVRSPAERARWDHIVIPDPHPLFAVIDGPVAEWERSAPQR